MHDCSFRRDAEEKRRRAEARARQRQDEENRRKVPKSRHCVPFRLRLWWQTVNGLSVLRTLPCTIAHYPE